MYTCYIKSFKILASFCSWAGWFESYLSKIPKDTFSRDVAHLSFNWSCTQSCYIVLTYNSITLIQEETIKTLKQASRLFHYCATPLLFSCHWRHNVVEKYRVTRQDSVASVTSTTATPDTKVVSKTFTCLHLSLITRKPVFGCDHVRLKPACSTTETKRCLMSVCTL